MGDVAIVERQGHERAHYLPALNASGTRVDNEAAQRTVGHHLEDVAVTAHEQFGT